MVTNGLGARNAPIRIHAPRRRSHRSRVAEVAEQAWQQKYDENKKLFALAFPQYADQSDNLDEALDVLFAIDSAAFARILIEDRGWSCDKYETWLTHMLERLFLDGAT